MILLDGVPLGKIVDLPDIDLLNEEHNPPNCTKLHNFGSCTISGSLPKSRELEELFSKIHELAEEEFQQHKIKKADYFKDPTETPAWLEDEFQICGATESNSLPKGKYVMYPWDIYQDEIIKYGTVIIKEWAVDKTYKRVLLIMGTGD